MPTKLEDAIAVAQVRPRGVGRRGMLGLLSRCLLMLSLPIASVPDAIASRREAPAAEVAYDVREADTRIQRGTKWTGPMDRELITRWMAHEPRPRIARSMGVSPGAIRVRATRLHLPIRNRASLVWS
jgi:hypothetical protein